MVPIFHGSTVICTSMFFSFSHRFRSSNQGVISHRYHSISKDSLCEICFCDKQQYSGNKVRPKPSSEYATAHYDHSGSGSGRGPASCHLRHSLRGLCLLLSLVEEEKVALASRSRQFHKLLRIWWDTKALLVEMLTRSYLLLAVILIV